MTTGSEDPFHILVVDDEPDVEPLIRQCLRRHVRSGEYALHFAGDGVDALDVLASNDTIDMVVTDINMPRMDGLSLLRRLPEVDPDLKAVVVSAYGDMGNIRTAMNCGAFDFIIKPFDLADLEITIKRARSHIAQWKEAVRSRDQLTTLQSELALASRMQQAILPVRFPSDVTFDVHAEMVPARQVGGDFFDIFALPHGRIGLLVADVSGKGVPAALFMMSSRTVLKGAAIGSVRPGAVLSEVNDFLHAENRDFMFVSVAYAVYDHETGAFSYANGGHCCPLVVHRDGSATMLPCSRGLVLGLREGGEYREAQARLAPGETLVMYSDGVSEAFNVAKEEFGLDRLRRLFEGAPPASAKEANTRVMKAVSAFAGAHEQSDDITCLALHRHLDS